MSHPYIHPTARLLLATHDQNNWSMTADKLICAPIGCYRILEYYEEGRLENDGPPSVAIAFAFDPKELDLVPHPKNPARKILKNPKYILRPIEDPSFEYGCAETAMRQHQGVWLNFVLTNGNLYYTDLRTREKNNGEYFSNNWISYGLFPSYNVIGQNIGYEVRFRANPFNKSGEMALNQDSCDTALHSLMEHGIKLKSFGTHDEAVQFIHENFNNRYNLFLEGAEILDWADPDILRNVLMWCSNQLSKLASEPSLVGSRLTKTAELASKLSISGLVSEFGQSVMEEGAEKESHASSLERVAEVEEGNLPPGQLYTMKEEVLENWVAVENPGPPLLISKLSKCNDLVAYRRARAIDIIHNPKPVIITHDFPSDIQTQFTEASAITARTRHGVNVHHIGTGTRYITYTPSDTKEELLVPEKYSPLFKEGFIACIKRCPLNEPLPEGAKIFHHMPHDHKCHLIYTFISPAEAIQDLQAHPHIIAAIKKHKLPVFEPPDGTPAPTKPLTAFQFCARNLLYYGSVILPTGPFGKMDLFWASVSSIAGGLIATNQFSEVYESANPAAFIIAGSFMTGRLAVRARTLVGKASFAALTKVLFAAAAVSYLIKSGVEVDKEILKDGLKLFSKDKLEDTVEQISATGTAAWCIYHFGISSYKGIRKAITLTKAHPIPVPLRAPQHPIRAKHLRRRLRHEMPIERMLNKLSS